MSSITDVRKRLEKIIPKIQEDKFLEGRGLGNEISFYVFDYDPKMELVVRDYVKLIKKEFARDGSNRRLIEIDLYKTMIEIAKEQRIFDLIFKIEEKQGREAIFKAMVNFAKPEVFLQKIKETVIEHNVVLITGIGKVYPFVRSHNILNNLQDVLDKIPVIMFFPGTYDGLSLKLFDRMKEDNYYRAFRLVE